MSFPIPATDLDSARAREVLGQIRPLTSVGARLEVASRSFLGAPYRVNPLGGGPSCRETLTVSLDSFDCVTYVESALAFAVSKTLHEFMDSVRRIRYRNGVVDWRHRNHYMTAWIRHNEQAGFVRNATEGPAVVERERILDSIDGVGSAIVRLRCLPKRVLLKGTAEVANGDLLFFASTKRHLDVFHVGLLVVSGKDGSIRLRHASRSRGHVVEQPLSSFLEANRMPGVILVRPRRL